MTITDFFEYLTGQVDHQPWRERANCRGLDPALFVMERGDNGGPAKAVCRECEVRSECLDYVLTHNERLGIWGMTSERERKVMRRVGNGVVV